MTTNVKVEKPQIITIDEFIEQDISYRSPYGVGYSEIFAAAREKRPDFDYQKNNHICLGVKPSHHNWDAIPINLVTIPLGEYVARIDTLYQEFHDGSIDIDQELLERSRKTLEVVWGRHRTITQEDVRCEAFDMILNNRLLVSYSRGRGHTYPIWVFLPGDDQFEIFCSQFRGEMLPGMQMDELVEEKRRDFFGREEVTGRHFYPIYHNKRSPLVCLIDRTRELPLDMIKTPTGYGEIWTGKQPTNQDYSGSHGSNVVNINYHGDGRSCADMIKTVAKTVQKFEYEAIFGIFRRNFDISSEFGGLFDILRVDPREQTRGGVFYKTSERE